MFGILGCLLLFFACKPAQSTTKMENVENPLMCDLEKGFCAMPGNLQESEVNADVSQTKPLKMLYFTDPICSSCWGIEPQLRRLKLEYGHLIEIEYHMGGLLPDWSYNSGGISKPSDVAHHWDEVSQYYQMPIDGDVWLEDPLPSSYPPSIAFKAAQMQDEAKAQAFLREIREMVFVRKLNITKWENLAAACKMAGLDAESMKSAMEAEAKTKFEQDLELARSMGVRGFPTIFLLDSLGNQRMIYGSRPYEVFQQNILSLHPAAEMRPYDKSPEHLFSHFHSLSQREFAELSGISTEAAAQTLKSLEENGMLKVQSCKNGSIWGR